MNPSQNNEREPGGARKSPRSKASDAYANARSSAASSLDEAPLIALAGGLAAGALLAALLPRSEAESRALRPVGKRIGTTARAAVGAARDAGGSRIDELGLTTEKAFETLRSILEGAGSAARASAQSAFNEGRKG